MRQARSENNDVQPPFYLSEHQTPYRRHTLSLFLSLSSLRLHFFCSLVPKRKQRQRLLVISRVDLTLWSRVWKRVWKVPPLEDLLWDVVAVVRAYGSLRGPTLLEDSRVRTPELEGECRGRNGGDTALVEVVEVFRVPALLGVPLGVQVLRGSSEGLPCVEMHA